MTQAHENLQCFPVMVQAFLVAKGVAGIGHECRAFLWCDEKHGRQSLSWSVMRSFQRRYIALRTGNLYYNFNMHVSASKSFGHGWDASLAHMRLGCVAVGGDREEEDAGLEHAFFGHRCTPLCIEAMRTTSGLPSSSVRCCICGQV